MVAHQRSVGGHRNVDVYSAAGMGIYCSRCGNINLNALRIDAPRAPWVAPNAAFRPVSINADGIHVVSQPISASFMMANCRIAAQGDDGLNINTPMAQITAVSPDQHTVAASDYANTFPFQNGDTVNVLNGATLQFQQQLADVQVDSGQHTFYTATAASLANVGDLVFAANAMSMNVQITSNYFGRNRGCGVRSRSYNTYIASNTFDRISANAVSSTIDSCFYFEGVNIIDYTFVGNTIVAANAGPGANYGAVTIMGNVPQFNPSGVPIPGTCTDSTAAVCFNVTVSSNTFIHNIFQPGNVPMTTVWIGITDGVGVADNSITRQSGVPVPSFELFGVNCVNTLAVGNVCNGGACSTSGL